MAVRLAVARGADVPFLQRVLEGYMQKHQTRDLLGLLKELPEGIGPPESLVSHTTSVM